MSVVVKGPLRRSGWVERKRDSGCGGGGDGERGVREPSLLSVVVSVSCTYVCTYIYLYKYMYIYMYIYINIRILNQWFNVRIFI